MHHQQTLTIWDKLEGLLDGPWYMYSSRDRDFLWNMQTRVDTGESLYENESNRIRKLYQEKPKAAPYSGG